MTEPTGDRLYPCNVRAVAFDVRRRGLDPQRVGAYLDRIADELDRLNRDRITAESEAERIRRAVRRWQLRQVRRVDALVVGPPRRPAPRQGAAATGTRWVVHLPTTSTSREAAAALVGVLRGSWGHLPTIDFGEATLSPEDHQSARTRVWCDARVAGSRRCPRIADHPGPCDPGP
ncbi:DivIVA domain-containing protein [Micromonospora sp. NPDC000207]|uniref:DivIVA domain-containing protein n=1 Tax=Micromonospora sp. NPDC000207 TaxID=3154246 RepID=UPI00332EDD84